MAYFSLFISALLAATLLPAQSEGLLVGLILDDSYLFWGLILAASVGNTLGSLVNWWLGYHLQRFQGRRWFPFSATSIEKAGVQLRKYGLWSLLLSWMPIIGDPLTLVAGFLRVRFWTFLLLVALAKTGRYLALGLPLYWYQS